MRFKKIKNLVLVLVIGSMFGCNYNSNIMLKTGKDYSYDEAPTEESAEYLISPSDILEFKLYTNDGNALVDFTAINEQGNRGSNSAGFNYLVEFDGKVKLPVIGRLELKGMTVKAVEELLEDKYAKFYIKPFVQVRVTNKRITVFPGGSNSAQVIPLANENMNLLEALGAVGGLSDLAKAKRIKLIRGNLKDPKVYLFDFSRIEGIQRADFVLQANDIIYIEPRTEYMSKVIQDVAPVMSLISSSIALYFLIENLKTR